MTGEIKNELLKIEEDLCNGSNLAISSGMLGYDISIETSLFILNLITDALDAEV